MNSLSTHFVVTMFLWISALCSFPDYLNWITLWVIWYYSTRNTYVIQLKRTNNAHLIGSVSRGRIKPKSDSKLNTLIPHFVHTKKRFAINNSKAVKAVSLSFFLRRYHRDCENIFFDCFPWKKVVNKMFISRICYHWENWMILIFDGISH